MDHKSRGFGIPALCYLSDTDIDAIHQAAITILESIGSQIRHQGAQSLLLSAGATVSDTGRILIPEALVETCLDTAPRHLLIHDRNGSPAMDLAGQNVYYGTGSDCQYILDPGATVPRDFLFRDVIDAVRLADSLPYIDFVMGMGLARDLDPKTQFQEKYAAMVRNTVKPLVLITGPDPDALEAVIGMASTVAEGRDELRKRPNFLLLVDPTSPLVHSFDAVDKLMIMARENLPVVYASGILAGATSPVTMAGAIAQAAAESLAGLVIHQLVSPGAPFVFGGGMSPMDMKSSQPTYSAPEAMMAQAGLCQLGSRRYRLPTWGFGGCTASKVCDAQAVNEAATYLMMSGWMGTNLVHDVGYMEFGMTYSLELMVLCNETIGQIRRMMDGIRVTDETLALDAIRRVGPGGTFLMDAHTMTHFRKNWQPDLTDRRTRQTWIRLGSTTMEERAAAKIREAIETHSPEPLDPDLDRKLAQYLNPGAS